MQAIKNIVIGTTTNEIGVPSGSTTNFVIPVCFVGIYGSFRLSKHFIHLYLFFLLQPVVWVFSVPMAVLFGMTNFFASTTY
jgi:hypothetical protein